MLFVGDEDVDRCCEALFAARCWGVCSGLGESMNLLHVSPSSWGSSLTDKKVAVLLVGDTAFIVGKVFRGELVEIHWTLLAIKEQWSTNTLRALLLHSTKGRLWQSCQGTLHNNWSCLLRKHTRMFESDLGTVYYTLCHNWQADISVLQSVSSWNIHSLIVDCGSVRMKTEAANQKLSWIQTAVNSFSAVTLHCHL